jgi:hypothetical protein
MQKLVVVSGLKVAIVPPDERRPYRYTKAEPICGLRLYGLVILTLWRHCSMSSLRLVVLEALLLLGPTML